MEGCYAARGLVAQRTVGDAGEPIDRQLTRLDVENGDILVLRTCQKLRPEMAAEWQSELQALCRSHGARDVTVVVLDDCSDLTVERPEKPDTRMQHQASPAASQPMQG
jgi:hypothetical protein